MHIAAVLFDLFNTLVLLTDGDAFYIPALMRLHESLDRSGVSVPFEDFKREYFQVRNSLYVESEKTLEEPHFNVRISQTLKQFGHSFGDEHCIIKAATEAFANEFFKHVRPDNDAVPLLRRLRQKHRVGLISNFAIPELVHKILVDFNLEGLFDVVLVSGAVNRRKPSAEIFQKALQALDVAASEAVYVGDTLSLDVKGAKGSGMKAILLRRKNSTPPESMVFVYKPQEENAKIEPDKVIESLAELPDTLEDC